MAFADAPVRDVEYRDLYGLEGLGAVGVPSWTGVVHRVAPIYLKARGYRVPWDAPWVMEPGSPLATAVTQYVNSKGMTIEQFEKQVSNTLIAVLAGTVVVTTAVVVRRRRRNLRTTAAQVAMADLSAWRNQHRRRRR